MAGNLKTGSRQGKYTVGRTENKERNGPVAEEMEVPGQLLSSRTTTADQGGSQEALMKAAGQVKSKGKVGLSDRVAADWIEALEFISRCTGSRSERGHGHVCA